MTQKLIHATLLGADGRSFTAIIQKRDVQPEHLREYLDSIEYTDYKLIDWELVPTVIIN